MRFLSLALAVLLSACTSIAPFDDIALKNATDMKVEADILIASATDSAANHKDEIALVKLHGKQAYEYARIKPNNNLSARQWEILMDPDRRILGGFIRRWEEKDGGYSEVFLLEVRGMVASALDEIIRLEQAK